MIILIIKLVEKIIALGIKCSVSNKLLIVHKKKNLENIKRFYNNLI